MELPTPVPEMVEDTEGWGGPDLNSNGLLEFSALGIPPSPRASPGTYLEGWSGKAGWGQVVEARHWSGCLGWKGAVEGREAGGGQEGVAVQKAALVAAWRRGLETRLRGAGPVRGKGRKNAAAEVSKVFQATHFSLCVVTVYLERPLTRGTVITWALPTSLGLLLPALASTQVPLLSNQFAVHTFFTKKNGHQRAQLCPGENEPDTRCPSTSLLGLLFGGCAGLIHPVRRHPRGHTHSTSVSTVRWTCGA